MEQDKELREKFSKVLGKVPTSRFLNEKDSPYSWEEIFNEIGKLQERAEKPPVERYIPQNPSPLMPLNQPNPNLHYHNGAPCYQNPCVWC